MWEEDGGEFKVGEVFDKELRQETRHGEWQRGIIWGDKVGYEIMGEARDLAHKVEFRDFWRPIDQH